MSGALLQRRGLLAGAAVALLPAAPLRAQPKPLRVGALLAGRIDDRGFMEAGWRGLERARTELGVRTEHIAGVAPQKDALAAALTQLALSGVDLVIAHGGQNNEAAAEVAARFPQQQFIVTQGAVTGPNLGSYEVLQEQSAYLAGVAAALLTRTGAVGHMSGIRVRPGLKGRAAYAAGVRATAPQVKLLTNFSGNQDDNALSRRVAEAQLAAGADIVFTMLNAGRDGVTQVCREGRLRQIGNVIDWVPVAPDAFVGSAIADVSVAVFEAVRAQQAGQSGAGRVHQVGLALPQAVRLSLAASVPAAVRERVAAAADDVRAGRIAIPEGYDGPDFPNPA